jgi:Zinc knuckle
VQESVKEQQCNISRLSKCLLETEGRSCTSPALKSFSRPKSNACFKCDGLGHFARDHKDRGRTVAVIFH